MSWAGVRAIVFSSPVLWLLAAGVVSAISAGEFKGMTGDPTLHDTYYVIAHAHYVMGLAALCAVFSAIYFLVERVFRLPYRRRLGAVHLGLTSIGALLIVSPVVGMAPAGAAGPAAEAKTMFATLSMLATIGYVMIYVGLIVFLALIVDSVRGRKLATHGNN